MAVDQQKFASAIKAYRAKANAGLDEIASVLECAPTTLKTMIYDRSKTPGLGLAERAAVLCGIPVSMLLTDDDATGDTAPIRMVVELMQGMSNDQRVTFAEQAHALARVIMGT